jgi:hypothetical protein
MGHREGPRCLARRLLPSVGIRSPCLKFSICRTKPTSAPMMMTDALRLEFLWQVVRSHHGEFNVAPSEPEKPRRKEDESDCGTNPGSRAKRSRWGFAQNEGNPRARMNLRCRAEQPRDVSRMNPALMFSRLCSVPSVGCRCEAAAGRRRLEPSAKLRMNPALVFSRLCSVSSVDARHPPVDVVSSPCQNCG